MSDTPRTDSVTFKAELGMMPICDTVPAVFARTLERELDEARDALNFRRELCALKTEQLDKVRDELARAREQSDEWKAKYIQQNKDLGCEMMDPNGTIWDYAKKLQAKIDAAAKGETA